MWSLIQKFLISYQQESDPNQGVGNKHRGQPSIASKFPTLVDSAADFVLQHSFAAQTRSRTNTGSSTGVSIAEIRLHLLDKVLGLKKHEISLSTVRDFFKHQTEEILLAKNTRLWLMQRLELKKKQLQGISATISSHEINKEGNSVLC